MHMTTSHILHKF